MRWKGAIPAVRGLYHAAGFNGARIMRLGGRRILLSVNDLEKPVQALSDFEMELSELSIYLNCWKPGPSHCLRIEWAGCYGVTWHGWDAKTFKDTGRRLGEEVSVAKEMAGKSRWELGQFCLQVTSDSKHRY